MITVLLTGGNGQLATCIKDIQKNYKSLNIIYTDYLELDVCDVNQIQAFFNTNQNINYCINCAAYTAVDKAETAIEKTSAVNADGAKNLAIACFENKIKLIQVSTDFVFEGNKTTPYKEDEEAKPINVYGKTKLKGEQEIIKVLKEYFIIRTSWLYSEYGTNFMKTILRLSETKDVLNVVNDQIGTPTYAKNLAEVILNIIASKSTDYGLYHYSNGGIASWFDFAKEILKLSGTKIKLKPISTTEYPTSAKRPAFSVIDTSKIKNTLGVAIPFWKDSLKSALSSFIKKDF